MNTYFSLVLQEWLTKPLPNITPRDNQLKIEDLGLLNKATVITGFRRSGKTYLLFSAIKQIERSGLGRKDVIYINFEDDRLLPQEDTLTQLLPAIVQEFGQKPQYLFLDELQNMPNWSKWLRRILDNEPIKIVVTGSSSRLSSYELPTELRGRSWETKIYPLSFTEYTRFGGQGFLDYLIYGGFPEVVLSPLEKKTELLQNYFQTVVQREIIERFKIKNDPALKALLRLLLNSTYFTVSKTYQNLKSIGLVVGKTTLNNFLGNIESSYFIRQLSIHSHSSKNKLLYPRKIYVVDNGFITTLSTKFSTNRGRLLENMVYWHLSRKHEELAYYKDERGKEVDFVVLQNGQAKSLYQVCSDLDDHETRNREINNLIAAGQKLKCEDLHVVGSSSINIDIPKEIKVIRPEEFFSQINH